MHSLLLVRSSWALSASPTCPHRSSTHEEALPMSLPTYLLTLSLTPISTRRDPPPHPPPSPISTSLLPTTHHSHITISLLGLPFANSTKRRSARLPARSISSSNGQHYQRGAGQHCPGVKLQVAPFPLRPARLFFLASVQAGKCGGQNEGRKRLWRLICVLGE